MKTTVHRLKLSYIITALLTVILSAGVLIYQNDVSQGILSGIDVCLNIIIPSLFVFMVFATMLSNGQIANILNIPLGKAVSILFWLPPSCGTVVFMSFIGGFPVGAKLISNLYRTGKVSKQDAEYMLSFCIGAGPAFLISGVGAVIFGNISVGILIFCIQFVSSVLLGIALKRWDRTKLKDYNNEHLSFKCIPFYQNFVSSVNSSARAILSVSAFIVLFSGICALISAVGITSWIADLLHTLGFSKDIINVTLTGILEVVSGCRAAGELPTGTGVILACGFLSFTGISVIFQILSVVHGTDISIKKFIVGRLIHPIISVVLCAIFIRFIPSSTVTAMSSSQNAISYSNASYTPVVSILMIILSVLLIFSNVNRDKSVDF